LQKTSEKRLRKVRSYARRPSRLTSTMTSGKIEDFFITIFLAPVPVPDQSNCDFSHDQPAVSPAVSHQFA